MKKMNKTLAIAIAAAMVSPSAFAAQDTSGMQFTSASEGFYASLRTRLDFSGSGDSDNAGIDDNSSRIGVRGSNDLGGGLSGFYQWEGELTLSDQDGPGIDRTRLGHVGLRGSFGEFVIGGFWSNDYNWTHGSTDIASNYSGYLTYNDQRRARSNESIQYTTPDLNGFQGAVRVDVGSNDTTLEENGATVYNAASPFQGGNLTANAGTPMNSIALSPGRSDNDIDGWNIAAKYDIQGFSVGASYNNLPDRLAKVTTDSGANDDDGNPTAEINAITGYEDATSWTIKSGYAQDNWYVNAWYGEDNVSDAHSALDDTEYFSIAGGVSVDKVNLYILHETRENSILSLTDVDTAITNDDTRTTIGAQYILGSQSRVWVEYWARDLDNNPAAEDIVSVGLRHDF